MDTGMFSSSFSPPVVTLDGSRPLINALPLLSQGEPVDEKARHEVVFVLKQNNLDKLEAVLMEVSDPKSAKYGQWLSSDDVTELIDIKDADLAVRGYLKSAGAKVVSGSKRGHIRASASIGAWNAMFNTTFNYFERADAPEGAPAAIRASEYSLDSSIASSVASVLYTTQLPVKMAPRGHATPKAEHEASRTARGVSLGNDITPAVLNSFYNIDSNTGSADASQAVFETSGQNYSPNDLATFQSDFSLPSQTVSTDVGAHASSTECEILTNDCTEANLDVQYMMGVSQVTPMTYYYESNEEDPFTAFVEAIAAESSPPLVNSISYGSIESEMTSSVMDTFNNEVMTLGAMGVSVFVSSGDDGVANYDVTEKSECGYNPSFPATSPYVTAVGATYASSWDSPGEGEVVCQSNIDDAVITSGGGFSGQFDAPSYQTAAITSYFSTVGTQPASGYATGGRGYPDLALSGFGYEVVIGADTYVVCGTSCSSPSVGAMVSLVNAVRLEAGASSLGFLNTALYTSGYGTAIANDITSGENQCTADDEVCCDEGFYAATGWDPTTGYGSVDYAKLEATFTADLDAGVVRAAKRRLVAKATLAENA